MSDSLNYSTSYAKSESNSKHDLETSSITFSQLVNDYVHSNKDLKGKKITFIKCDIEGGEERILKEVLTYAKENKCKVWMSFHYSWWKNKNILEYKDQLEEFHAFCSKGDVCLFVQKNPFCSVLLVPKS